MDCFRGLAVINLSSRKSGSLEDLGFVTVIQWLQQQIDNQARKACVAEWKHQPREETRRETSTSYKRYAPSLAIYARSIVMIRRCIMPRKLKIIKYSAQKTNVDGANAPA